ncbi:hypothetical protein [Sphingobium olei]|uniref:Uncharacterized protein n=1 Tax=Sphingobium olei TaxID=420955 RepID=A0ABW3NYI2_9SPHN
MKKITVCALLMITSCGLKADKDEILSEEESKHLVQNSDLKARSIYSGKMVPSTYKFYGVIRSVLNLQPQRPVQHAAAIDAYIFNASPQGSAPTERNAVGLFVAGVNAVDRSATWAINTALNDAEVNGSARLRGRKLIGWEADFDISGASTVEGMAMLIQGAGQPANANAFQIGRAAGAKAKWTNGYIVNDGAASYGLQIGANGEAGANVPGIPNMFSYRDKGATRQQMKLSAVNGAFDIGSTEYADQVSLFTGNNNVGMIASGGSANVNLKLSPKGAGSIRLSNSSDVDVLSVQADRVRLGAPAMLSNYAVRQLPKCDRGMHGAMAAAVDLKTVSYNAAPSGGGSFSAPVFCNGASWTIH